jgi:hypothetical protein
VRLVSFDVISEKWFSCEIEDREVYWPIDGDGEYESGSVVYGGQGGGSACSRRRTERVWWYEYLDGLRKVRGVACIAINSARARMQIMQALREARRTLG